MADWYYAKGGEQLGPVDDAGLKQLAASGKLLPTEYVWKDGEPEWLEASAVPGLFSAGPAAPNPSPQTLHPLESSPARAAAPATVASGARLRTKHPSKTPRRLLLVAAGCVFLGISIAIFCLIRNSGRTTSSAELRDAATVQAEHPAHLDDGHATSDLSTPSEVAGPWISVLSELDTKTAAGWKFRNETLTGQQAKGKKGPAIIALSPAPSGDFDIQLTFKRGSGMKEFCVLFPVGSHGAQLTVGAGAAGQTTSVAGGRVFEIGSDVQIADDKDEVLGITVRVVDQNANITVTLNGHPYGNFRDKVSKLQQPINPPKAAAISLAVVAGTKVEFRDIRMRSVGGSIKTIQ